MCDLKRIEPIEECSVRACNGSEAKAISHRLSSGTHISLLCDGPFMLTLESALVLGRHLVNLATRAAIATRQN